jgi:hypothetical protein
MDDNPGLQTPVRGGRGKLFLKKGEVNPSPIRVVLESAIHSHP